LSILSKLTLAKTLCPYTSYSNVDTHWPLWFVLIWRVPK